MRGLGGDDCDAAPLCLKGGDVRTEPSGCWTEPQTSDHFFPAVPICRCGPGPVNASTGPRGPVAAILSLELTSTQVPCRGAASWRVHHNTVQSVCAAFPRAQDLGCDAGTRHDIGRTQINVTSVV